VREKKNYEKGKAIERKTKKNSKGGKLSLPYIEGPKYLLAGQK